MNARKAARYFPKRRATAFKESVSCSREACTFAKCLDSFKSYSHRGEKTISSTYPRRPGFFARLLRESRLLMLIQSGIFWNRRGAAREAKVLLSNRADGRSALGRASRMIWTSSGGSVRAVDCPMSRFYKGKYWLDTLHLRKTTRKFGKQKLVESDFRVCQVSVRRCSEKSALIALQLSVEPLRHHAPPPPAPKSLTTGIAL